MSHSVRNASTVSRRNFFKLMVVGAGSACLAANAPSAWAASEQPGSLSKKVTIAIMSDLHYFSPSLWSECPDYTTAENSDRKMFKESAAILDAALASIVAAKPDVVLVPGDLTKDSELACHKEAHAKISAARDALKAAGVDTKFLVINGNHDVNNANGLDFSSGVALPAEHADPKTFKSIWADCGYEDALACYDAAGAGAGSLSYVSQPVAGLTVIAVDSCKYSADQTASGTNEHETGGIVGLDLLAWVVSQASKASQEGNVVLVMQHHGVVPHFADEPTLLGDYLVDNYETVAPAYADAGVNAVITGHMHANDIAGYTSPSGMELFDIETDSLVTYPSYIRTGTLSWQEREGGIDALFAVNVASLGAVSYGSYANLIPGATDIADITAYGKERTLTQDVVETVAKDFLSQTLAQLHASGGLKPALAALLNTSEDELAGYLFNMVAGMLPTTFEEGAKVSLKSFNFSIWYDAAAAQVKIDQYKEVAEDALQLRAAVAEELGEQLEAQAISTFSIEPSDISLYIDAASLGAFFDDTCAHIDEAILANPASTEPLIDTLAEALLTYAVDDSGHTVLGLVDYAYQIHLMGDETCESWAESAIQAVRGSESNEGGMLTSVLAHAVNTAQPDLTALLESVSLNVSLLVMKGNSNFMTTMVLSLLKTLVKDGGDVIGLVAEDGTLGNLIPDIPALSAFAHSALYTLSHDDNVATDHAFSLTTRVKDVVPSKPGDGDGSGTGGEAGSGSDAGGTAPEASENPSQEPSGSPAKPGASLPQTGDAAAAALLGTAAIAGAGAFAARKAWRKMKDEQLR